MGHAVSSDVYCLHSVYELYIAIAPSRGNSTALRREQPKIRALGVFVRLSPPSLPSNLSRLAAFSFKSGSRSTDIILPINQNRVLSNATQDNRVALLQLCFPGEYRECSVSSQMDMEIKQPAEGGQPIISKRLYSHKPICRHTVLRGHPNKTRSSMDLENG